MTASLKPLKEQVIVITGASSGIGLATAQEAAACGAKVVLAARSAETLEAIVAEITSRGGEAVAVAADVSNRTEVERIAQVALERFGRIDTWINNAGVGIYGRVDEISEKDNRRLFDINFWGVVNGSLVALPFLRASGGALINVGSEVSEAVVPLQGMYAASKHAIKGFTDALRVEVEHVDQANVSITLVQPTAVNTPWPQHAKNYMAQEPKLPTPQIDPGQVAEAILSAAASPTRDVKVGAMATLNTAMAKFMPALGDRMSAKQVDRQQYEEPPRDPDGTLYVPGQSGRTHGSGGMDGQALPRG
ncbi:MAG TPA: SDR family oxidoreductase [Polyangiaceae bacterium]|nr:SDR family oxidoreductase [Polyangiaceae bacterium]